MPPEGRYLSLIPLSLLAVVYWLRDRYLFNRTPVVWWRATRVQWQVLVLLYPVWIFLTWSMTLQYRHHIGLAFVSSTGAQIVDHLTSTAILNDSFLQTRQQVLSSLLGLMIAYLWATHDHLTHSVQDDVRHVDTYDRECECQ